jgi:hypothetical protein
MRTTRLEAFSDAVIAIMWLVPDRRIESRLEGG